MNPENIVEELQQHQGVEYKLDNLAKKTQETVQEFLTKMKLSDLFDGNENKAKNILDNHLILNPEDTETV